MAEQERQAFIDAAADYLTNRSPGCEWARDDCLAKLRALDAAYEREADLDTLDTKQAATCPSFNETDRLRHALDWIANHATTLEEAQALARRTYGEHHSAHPVSDRREEE